jgi:predicted transcriptional regulator
MAKLTRRAHVLIGLADMEKPEHGGFTVSHVASRLGLSQAETFKHLESLRQSGFLHCSTVATHQSWIYECVYHLRRIAHVEVDRLRREIVSSLAG